MKKRKKEPTNGPGTGSIMAYEATPARLRPLRLRSPLRLLLMVTSLRPNALGFLLPSEHTPCRERALTAAPAWSLPPLPVRLRDLC